jgi:hypothetical protein
MSITPVKSPGSRCWDATGGAGTVPVVLAGRDAERARIAAFIDAARAGQGGALVVRGLAGSGKSTLLASVVEDVAAAAELTVLRTSGVESESPLAFAALQRLLWPLRSGMDSLPGPQQAALRAAFGEAEGQGDRFLVFLGTLSLLAQAAEAAPILAVIDDAHWLDEASAAALLFVARRLQAEPIALLFAARDAGQRRFEAEGLPSLQLGGITGADAGAVLRARAAGDVDPGVRDQLVAATGGNPLALNEIAGALSAAQLAGRAPLPVPLPLTGGVEHAFLDRYRRLPERAQRFLLVAAADDTGRLTVVRAAAEQLDVDDAAVDETERTGLLRIDGDAVVLHHPLVRSAVYRAATSTQRRSAHRALSEALTGDPDRRAWHLAAAADRPDGKVVAALDGVAERAAARGGHEAASAAWARAAELTVGGPDRGRRLFLAASSAWTGAHPSRAVALASAAAALVTDPLLRAQLLTLQGQIEWNTRSLNDGYDLILQAAQVAAAADQAMAQHLAMLAAALAAFGARSPRVVDLAALVPAPAPDATPHVRAAFELLHGFLAVADRDYAAASASIRRAFALTDDDPPEDHVLQPNLGIASSLIDDDVRNLRLHDQQLTLARRTGALSMAEHALTRGFHAHLATGAWSRAAAGAAEALPLAGSTGHPGLTAMPTVELALVAALRGEDAAADRRLGEVAAIRAAHPVGITDGLVVDLSHWTRGLLAVRQPGSAVHHLDQITGPPTRRMAAIDLFDAAIRADRADVARRWLTEVAGFAEATGTASAIAAAAHSSCAGDR